MAEWFEAFRRDRSRGKAVEFLAAYHLRVLTHHKQAMVVPTGLFGGYDLIDEGTGRTIEVKADWRAADTDHFLVEYKMRGEASGIAATRADDWMFFDGETFAVLAVDSLADVVRQHGGSGREITGKGDRWSKLVYRVRRAAVFSAGITFPLLPGITEDDVPRSLASPSQLPTPAP